MLSTFDKTLGKKILYKDPLFIIEVKLKDNHKSGGSDSNTVDVDDLYSAIMKDEEIRVRFMFAVHQLFENPCEVLRNIFQNESFDNVSKYRTIVSDNTNKFLYLNDKELTDTIKKIYDELKSKEQEIELIEIDLNDESRYFLELWSKFLGKSDIHLRSINDITKVLKNNGITVVDVNNNRNDVERNPLYYKTIKIAQ